MIIQGGTIRGGTVYDLTDLFPFTTFTFTSAGMIGSTGPTIGNCYATYSNVGNTWLQNTNYFNVATQGYQRWTVPHTGTYLITVAGSRSGYNAYAAAYRGNTWGNGTVITGAFNLTRGANLTIAVGQYPPPTQNNGAYNGAGGGGGTFVILGNTTPLIIAGGGGGTGAYSAGSYPGQANGRNATTSINGNSSVGGAPGGLDGQGGNSHVNASGTVSLNPYDGGGGGGFYSNGVNGAGGNIRTNITNGSTGGAGQGFFANLIGGVVASTYSTQGSAGGFGGGGGGTPIAGGGGGGWSGGGGGYYNGSTAPEGGGGGGSYISSTVVSSISTSDGNYNGSTTFNGINITNLAAFNANSGYVQITKIA